MATAKKSSSNKSPSTRKGGGYAYGLLRGRWVQLALVLAVAVAALLYFYSTPLLGYSRTGAAYGAHVACSCRYIGGRDMGSCKGDMEDGMSLVFLSDNPEAKSVTARVPLLASATARYRDGWGCVLDKWDD